ncbi:hypothetical protein M9H77_30036 [Catharanthus roseus]|uniref:Uncharacterized protein n=1 Tax=Catharanthus roseus TaxID=4058 RepID=A0ACB9ZWX3_CATRO|nr:hypothetical protein M9H77_30036 [Catharanthus roseus]
MVGPRHKIGEEDRDLPPKVGPGRFRFKQYLGHISPALIVFITRYGEKRFSSKVLKENMDTNEAIEARSAAILEQGRESLPSSKALKIFEVDEVVAKQSVTIEHSFEDSNILVKIIEYCKRVLTQPPSGENDVGLKAFVSELFNDDE